MNATSYRTPVGTFDDPDAAVDACSRCDHDPDSCIRIVKNRYAAGPTEYVVSSWEVIGEDHNILTDAPPMRLTGRPTFADAERTAALLRECGYQTVYTRPVL